MVEKNGGLKYLWFLYVFASHFVSPYLGGVGGPGLSISSSAKQATHLLWLAIRLKHSSGFVEFNVFRFVMEAEYQKNSVKVRYTGTNSHDGARKTIKRDPMTNHTYPLTRTSERLDFNSSVAGSQTANPVQNVRETLRMAELVWEKSPFN